MNTKPYMRKRGDCRIFMQWRASSVTRLKLHKNQMQTDMLFIAFLEQLAILSVGWNKTVINFISCSQYAKRAHRARPDFWNKEKKIVKVHWYCQIHLGPFLLPARISNGMPNKVCHEITCPFSNFNGCTTEVWKWISIFMSHNMMGAIIHLFWH